MLHMITFPLEAHAGEPRATARYSPMMRSLPLVRLESRDGSTLWALRPKRQTLPHGVGRSLGAVGAAGLGEDIADVRRRRIEADRQHGRDVGVATADGDQAQHLGLARGQVVGRAGPGQFIEA